MSTDQNVIMTPIQVGPCTFKNRIMMAAMETRLSTPLGDTTQEMCDYYAERAKGGAAAIIVENTYVDNIASRSSLASSGLYSDQLIAGKYKLADAIKRNGAVAILQLSHGGLQANAAAVPGQEAVAPSAVASKFVGRMPRPLEHDEIVAIEDAFAEAARRAKQAGFDGVEIHGAHGYLICEFLSQYTNKRTDEYGGSRENRARFALNILKKVRAKVGENFLVGFRISGEEKVEGGMTIEDACAFGKMFEEYIDYIHVSVGNYETMATWMISPMYRPAHAIVDLASAMKKAVTKCKVVTVNALTAETAEQALENDDADLVAFARPLLADPYLPLKIKEGRLEDIRPCMRGHEGCISLFFRGCPIRCEVNPQAGQEREYQIIPVAEKDRKRIVVVGGGMAGMETARVASLYGHDVTLIERSDRLGGHFIEASEPKFKNGARGDLLWLVRQVKKAKIRLFMKTEATSELLADLKPDAVVLAVGSDYMIPSIPGIENTMTADKALLEKDSVKGKTVIIGGGLVGSETALGLAKEGTDVTILEMMPDIVMQDEPLSQIAIKGELATAKAKIITNAKVTEIHPDAVVFKRDGKTEKVQADTIIAAFGLKERKNVVDTLKDVCPDTYVIGDAVRGRKLYQCMHEAWDAVRKISSGKKNIERGYSKQIRTIDHVALTVPDLDQATEYFAKAFDGKVVYEGLTRQEEPLAGSLNETKFGMPKGGRVAARRVMNIGGSVNVELFCYEGMEHQSSAHTYDYGLQHFAVYVDDLQQAAQNVLTAGGKLYETDTYIDAVRNGRGPSQGWLYTETPWGSVIEMVTFKEA